MDPSKSRQPTIENHVRYPTFQSLPPKNIILIKSIEQCQNLTDEFKHAVLFGFDTESKPTFTKGEISTGPHLIQLATFDTAYLFQVSPEILAFLSPIFANPKQLKVGFGLKNDTHLFRKKGIELNGIVDLAKAFKSFGVEHQIGVRNAMALLFKVDFHKNKKISTSNWSKKKLSPEQIHYAAADAYAPVLIFQELLGLGLIPKNISTLALELGISANPVKSQYGA